VSPVIGAGDGGTADVVNDEAPSDDGDEFDGTNKAGDDPMAIAAE